MRDPRVRAHGLQLEPIAFPATGDVVDLLGARPARFPRPRRPRPPAAFDAHGVLRAFGAHERSGVVRRVIVGMVVVSIGVATWLGAAPTAEAAIEQAAADEVAE